MLCKDMNPIKHREFIFIRGFLTCSLLCSTILAGVLSFTHPKWNKILLGLFFVTFLGWCLITYLHRKKGPLNIFLSIAVLNLCAIVPELSLRIANFRYESGIQFGYPRPSNFIRYEPDEQLFWKLKASEPDVNSLGFPGKKIIVPKSENVLRLLFLGDSCTQQGYPEIVARLLNDKYSNRSETFESITLAVAGYSSYQGRILADMYGTKFEPELVIVYFGWNDHWQAYRSKDSEKKITLKKNKWIELRNLLYCYSRLIQANSWIWDKLTGSVVTEPIEEVRVPIDEYRENLTHIRTIFVKANIPILFITAPTSHYQVGVPDYLVEAKFVQNKQSGITLHQAYNQEVRNIARFKQCFLLDLEAAFNSLPEENLRELFIHDGIHFTQSGLMKVAECISESIESRILHLAPLSN